MDNLTSNDLLKLIGTGSRLIYIVAFNERRVEEMVATAAARVKGSPLPLIWTCADGFSRGGSGVEKCLDPVQALDYALDRSDSLLFLFKDLPAFWKDNPFILRRIKDFAAGSRGRGKVFILIGDETQIPEQLREEMTIAYQGMPTPAEVRTFLEGLKDREPLLADACTRNPDLLDRLVQAGQGLDLSHLERAVRMLRLSRQSKGDEIVQALFENKRQIIQKSGIMEFVLNDAGPDQIGGMENLKQWMTRRERAFGVGDISSGAKLPKGILMMGIAGCGKSLFVKAIASQWRLPLIRLDMATVYAGTYGSPESSLRKAFKTAEAISPCVLWIDEIEAGISSAGFKAEGGPASRILGYFLTWMQEKREPVFVAATANAIEMLPAEVLRKGRFDEIFYVGLPETEARQEIFRIHLTKQKANLREFDLPLLAGSTKGFSGAEVEQAVLSAVFEARADGRKLTQQDLMVAASRTVPLSVTMAEQIKKIEAWAFKRAVPASGKFAG